MAQFGSLCGEWTTKAHLGLVGISMELMSGVDSCHGFPLREGCVIGLQYSESLDLGVNI